MNLYYSRKQNLVIYLSFSLSQILLIYNYGQLLPFLNIYITFETILDDKEKQRQLRDAAVVRAQKRNEEMKDKNAELKRERDRFGVSQQMKVC